MEYLSRKLSDGETRNNRLSIYLTEHLLDKTRTVRLWNYHESEALPGLYVLCAPTTVCGHCILSADEKLISVTIYVNQNYRDLFDTSTVSGLVELVGKPLF